VTASKTAVSDGKNAEIRLRAEMAGAYTIQVLGEGAGTYLLRANTFLPGDMNIDLTVV